MSKNNIQLIACDFKKTIKEVSPFIQKHTSIVCPTCEKVCCIDRHSSYDNEDLIFISAIGIEIPSYIPGRKDTEPCRFLSEQGCSLHRWERPFRCTWYFCEPLLESMRMDRGKTYRVFIDSFRRLISIRKDLIE